MSKKCAQAQTYDNNISIDLKHSQLLEQYNTIETEIIPQLNEEKATIKSSLSGLKKQNITKYLEAKDRLVEIRDELRKLKTSKKQYLLVESYKNEKELFNLQCWALTCNSFFSKREWEWILRKNDFNGNYEFIYFQ